MWADLGSMIDYSGMIMVDVGCERADLGFKRTDIESDRADKGSKRADMGLCERILRLLIANMWSDRARS